MIPYARRNAEEEKPDRNNYYVFYDRDAEGKTLSQNKYHREVYDSVKEFQDLEKARAYAYSKLKDMPLIVKKTLEYSPNDKYIVAAYFESKYQHYCYDGSSDPVPTHEIERCRHSELEKTIRTMSEEKADKIYMGLELSLFEQNAQHTSHDDQTGNEQQSEEKKTSQGHGFSLDTNFM